MYVYVTGYLVFAWPHLTAPPPSLIFQHVFFCSMGLPLVLPLTCSCVVMLWVTILCNNEYCKVQVVMMVSACRFKHLLVVAEYRLGMHINILSFFLDLFSTKWWILYHVYVFLWYCVYFIDLHVSHLKCYFEKLNCQFVMKLKLAQKNKILI